jgi:hypothetical protein
MVERGPGNFSLVTPDSDCLIPLRPRVGQKAKRLLLWNLALCGGQLLMSRDSRESADAKPQARARGACDFGPGCAPVDVGVVRSAEKEARSCNRGCALRQAEGDSGLMAVSPPAYRILAWSLVGSLRLGYAEVRSVEALRCAKDHCSGRPQLTGQFGTSGGLATWANDEADFTVECLR